MIVDYCTLVGFKNEVPYPKTIREDMKIEDVIKDDKEREFILKLNDQEILNLVVCANFMNIKRLYEVCCARIAHIYRRNVPANIVHR